ncbi:MAG: 2-hydroxyglutaryl-CoA dehydratase [Firmicutes bacterium]|nr:2-hydroxyglutaryl-CoA dehydratase [Bacillota bacterium]
MYSIGIDTGSVATKGVIFNGRIIDHITIPTGWSPKESSKKVLDILLKNTNAKKEDIVVVATGYGRIAIPFADKTITEITCHGKGANYLNENVRTIIDIGGQDSKVINIDNLGNVTDFLMNDKCAAGTGRFLEVMVNLLGTDISELDNLSRNEKPETISSMCTVFAESEVISLLAKDASKESIASGIIHSIAKRTTALVGKLNITDDILFTGGLAKSEVTKDTLSEKLKRDIYTSPHAQLAGALGAAIIGWNKFDKLK